MKKILMLAVIMSSFSYAKVYDFLQSGFKAVVIENSVINNSKKNKVYDLTYAKDKTQLKIVKPKLNEGEIYTYTKDSKFLYSPKLKQEIKQSLSSQDESLYAILSELANLDEAKTQSRNGKDFVFENGKLKSIVAKNYEIIFKEFKNNKPTKILFSSNSVQVEYEIKY